MTKTVWIDLPGGPQPYELPEDAAAALERAQTMAEAQAEMEDSDELAEDIDTLFAEGLLPVPPELFADLVRSGEIQIVQSNNLAIPMGADVAQYF